jgi:hypothetical protein
MIAFFYIGVILLVFAAIAGVSDYLLHLQDKSLNARFRENQRIHQRKETP